MKRKPIPKDKSLPPKFERDSEFIWDSQEQVTRSIEQIGYRDKLDQAFKAAIARAKEAAK
ncbi:MAG: hypothetical protein A2Z02_02955 [Chloroflexi bacterium RBG_16_48_7]|nr:MAG: hypothetical protein A2Z02_02955 [Chloroflexi bacterium RBG_16_48_7]